MPPLHIENDTARSFAIPPWAPLDPNQKSIEQFLRLLTQGALLGDLPLAVQRNGDRGSREESFFSVSLYLAITHHPEGGTVTSQPGDSSATIKRTYSK